MIEKVTGYKVGEQFFPTIEEAQRQELAQVLHGLDDGADQVYANNAASIIINNKDKVLDILTMRPSSKPKARKINGGRKVRKSSLESAQASEVMKP